MAPTQGRTARVELLVRRERERRRVNHAMKACADMDVNFHI
jgi:hypothetical protein